MNMFSFDVDDGLFETYIFYSAVLVLKVLAMTVLTAQQRYAKMVILYYYIQQAYGTGDFVWFFFFFLNQKIQKNISLQKRNNIIREREIFGFTYYVVPTLRI